MITIEGIQVHPSLEALQPGDGFIVRLHVNWNLSDRQAQRQAQEKGIIGQRVNTHEATYADARAAIGAAMDALETDVQNFISSYNSQ